MEVRKTFSVFRGPAFWNRWVSWAIHCVVKYKNWVKPHSNQSSWTVFFFFFKLRFATFFSQKCLRYLHPRCEHSLYDHWPRPQRLGLQRNVLWPICFCISARRENVCSFMRASDQNSTVPQSLWNGSISLGLSIFMTSECLRRTYILRIL